MLVEVRFNTQGTEFAEKRQKGHVNAGLLALRTAPRTGSHVPLELGRFGQVEIFDFHGGDYHFEGFFGGGAGGGGHGFDVLE